MSFSLIPSIAGSSLSLGVTLVVIMDCVMTFFGSSANDACFNAWITDSTNTTNRGKAEGINSMMPLLAVLAVFGGFIGFDLSLKSSWTTIFVIIGIVAIICGIIVLFILEEGFEKKESTTSYFRDII